MTFLKRLLRLLKNKFVLSLIGFGVWMLFFDQNDFFTQRQRRQELNHIRGNIRYLNQEIASMQREYDRLITDPQALEKFAREHYRMKRENEDVYIINEQPGNE